MYANEWCTTKKQQDEIHGTEILGVKRMDGIINECSQGNIQMTTTEKESNNVIWNGCRIYANNKK